MSKYYVNKFLYQVDGDPDLLAAYKADPVALIEQWEHDRGTRLGNGGGIERTSWLSFTPEERRALETFDYVSLFELGVHYFLTLTLFIALYDEEFTAASGPLSFQRGYAAALEGWIGRPYPSVAL